MDRDRPALGWHWGQLVYALPLAFLLVFFFYPLAAIIQLSLAPDGKLALDALAKLVASDFYLRTLWFTFWQAALSTLLTLLAALPATYVFARYDFPGKSTLMALTTVPFVLPTIVVAAAFTALLGPHGLLNAALMRWLALDSPPIQLQHTLWIILLAHVFYNYTVVLRMVSGFWSNLNPSLEEAARVLGGNHWQVWWRVTLPLLAPSIAAAASLVFVFTFTSFGVILILGGPQFATLEVEIFRQARNLFNLPVAAALSLVQIVFTLAVMWVYTRLQVRTAAPIDFRSRASTQRRPRGGSLVLLVASLTLMLSLLLTPLLALGWRALTVGGEGLTLRYFRELSVNRRDSVFFVPPVEAIRNSLAFAALTVLLAVLLGLISASLLARRRSWLTALLDPVFMLPLGTSAVTLGFGFIVALDHPPLNLRTSPLLIPLAHTLVAFPFVVRSVLPVLRGINPHLREAAGVLGAPPPKVWRRIDLPIVGQALLVGAVFAFTVSLGEFGATIFIARPNLPTMPVAIYRFLGQPGALNYGQALAMSTILAAVTGVGMLLIERFRFGGVGEF